MGQVYLMSISQPAHISAEPVLGYLEILGYLAVLAYLEVLGYLVLLATTSLACSSVGAAIFHFFTLSPLKGASHLFTFSPSHLFTFKRLFSI